MKYEKDHYVKPGIVARDTLFLRRNPDMSMAAQSGDPAMTTMRPSVPPLVPQPAGAAGFNGEVTATTVGNSTALDTKPDARANPPAQGDATTPAPAGSSPAAATPAAGQTAASAPSVAASTDASQQSTQAAADPNAKKKKKNKKQQQTAAPTTDQPATATPAAAQPATPTTPPSN
jgi:hypothetical protein